MKSLRPLISVLLVTVCILALSYHPLAMLGNASASGDGGGEKTSKSNSSNQSSTTTSVTNSIASNSTPVPTLVNFYLSYSVNDGNPSAPWFAFTLKGVHQNMTLSRAPTNYQLDANSTWNAETTIPGILGEIWILDGYKAIANMNLVFKYAHQYRLMTTVDPVDAGTATPTEEWVNSAGVAQVQASPNPGFMFDHWSCEGKGCVSEAENPIPVTLNGPVVMTAHFVQVASVKIQSSSGNGHLFIDNTTTVAVNSSSPYVPHWRPNSNHTIQALSSADCDFALGPFQGCRYQFQQWLVNGATPTSGVSGDTYSFEVVGGTTSITVVYRQDYTNLEIVAAFTIGIVAATLYLRPKKHAIRPIVVTRGLSYQYSYLTDVGKVRKHNEDSVIAMEISATFSSNPMSVLLCAVADGVGGARKGEVASQLTIQTVTAELLRRIGSAGDMGEALKTSIEAANEAVANYGMEHRESEGLVTTIVASILDGGTAYVAHVGDSRAYFLNRAGIKQLTKDHSQVQELIDANQLTPEQARHHPARNVITRAVGSATDIQVSVTRAALAPGDRILLCSDGLWGSVSESEIVQIVFQSGNPQAACNQLVSLANQRGGRDNISVVIVEVKIPDEKLKT